MTVYNRSSCSAFSAITTTRRTNLCRRNYDYPKCSGRYTQSNQSPLVELQSTQSPTISDNVSSSESVIRKSQKLSLAPMMDYTDRHFRHLIRLLSRHTLTYTEMITSNAIVHEFTDAAKNSMDDDDEYLRRMLASPEMDEPCILQLGGSDAEQLQSACEIVERYKEVASCTGINLNCGCPSPKVAGKGCFGAALMDDATLVRAVTTAKCCELTTSCRIVRR